MLAQEYPTFHVARETLEEKICRGPHINICNVMQIVRQHNINIHFFTNRKAFKIIQQVNYYIKTKSHNIVLIQLKHIKHFHTFLEYIPNCDIISVRIHAVISVQNYTVLSN